MRCDANVKTSVRSLSRATGIYISCNNELQPISILAIICQGPKSSQLLTDIVALKFLIARSRGSRYRRATARPRICNFSTMQRGASWPSNLNLRLARYHLRVRSSRDVSKYSIAVVANLPALNNDRPNNTWLNTYMNTVYNICFVHPFRIICICIYMYKERENR